MQGAYTFSFISVSCQYCVKLKSCGVELFTEILYLSTFFSQSYHPVMFPVTTAVMVVLTVAVLTAISLVGVVFYVLAVLSITLLCPFLFVRLQRLKKLGTVSPLMCVVFFFQ